LFDSHLLTSSPPHLLTSSPPHLLTSSPPHLLTSSPPHLQGFLPILLIPILNYIEDQSILHNFSWNFKYNSWLKKVRLILVAQKRKREG
jgi:hypothetical protein